MQLDVLIKRKMRLQRHELSPAQKKHLWLVMSRYKATSGFSYNRFFKDGFKEWEMLGVEKVKSEFINLHPEIGMQMEKDNIFFYRAVVQTGLRKKFLSYMSRLGMGENQAYEKFGVKEEKPFIDYERVGIISIFKEFIEEVKTKNIV